MTYCGVCGGELSSGNAREPTNHVPCTCTLKFLTTSAEIPGDETELLHLQSRQFELQDNLAKLADRLQHLNASNSKEYDVDDHLNSKKSFVSQLTCTTLTSNPRRNPTGLPKPMDYQSPKTRRRHLMRNGTDANAEIQMAIRPTTAPGKTVNELADLLSIREEIAMLHKKFDEELQGVREILSDKRTKMTRICETPIVPVKPEGKENATPSILTDVQQAFLETLRHRKQFENNMANCERSHALRDIFDILGHLKDGDVDVIRVKALLEDAVNNLEIPRKSKTITPTIYKSSSRIARLSRPKRVKAGMIQPQKLANQRPSSSPPKSTLAEQGSLLGKPTGFADLVDFSVAKPTTAPLMKRPKVILPSVTPPREDTPGTGRTKTVRFDKNKPSVNNQRRILSSVPTLDTKKPPTFLPLGMRQYSMWPTEKPQASAQTSPLDSRTSTTTRVTMPTTTVAVDTLESEEEALTRILRHLLPPPTTQSNQPVREVHLTQDDLKEVFDAVLRENMPKVMKEVGSPPTSSPQLCHVNVGTCRRDFTEEKALSPIHSLIKSSTDKASSPQPMVEPSERISRGHSAQSIGRSRSSSLLSLASEVTVTSGSCRTAGIGSGVSYSISRDALGSNATSTKSLSNNMSECRQEITAEALTNRSEICSESWVISSTQTEVKITQPMMVSNNRTQSPIVVDNGKLSPTIIPTGEEEEDEDTEWNGFSLTELRSFSDGVWLDADRSEGEAGGIAISGVEEAMNLAKKLGPLPSPSGTSETWTSTSEAVESHSDGEFTLDLINKQPELWIVPWRDPLLHLIALNAAGKNSKLPWNQQRKVKKVAKLLEHQGIGQTSDPAEMSCASGEDLNWVQCMAARLEGSSPPSTTNEQKSMGEVLFPVPMKLRRAILAQSSQRLRQRNISLSDEENTLESTAEETLPKKQVLLSAVKSLSDEEIEDEIEENVIAIIGSSRSEITPNPQDDSIFDVDPAASSETPTGPL